MPSVVATFWMRHVQILGRLGNQMMGYAMMLALREAYGYDVFLDPSALHNLRHYFDVGSQHHLTFKSPFHLLALPPPPHPGH